MNLSKAQLSRMCILILVTFALSLGLFLSGVLTTFEYKAFDLLSRNLNPDKGPNDIVVVKIDQRSIDALSRENINWPWPRQMYAPLLDYLSQADGVLMDIIFTEPSSYGEEDDLLLAEALKKSGNVFLPIFLAGDDRKMEMDELEFMKRNSMPDLLATRLSYRSAITNIGNVRTAARGAGNVAIKPDSDGTYRRVPLSFKFHDQTIPNFVVAFLLKQGKLTVKNGMLVADEKPLPLAEDSCSSATMPILNRLPSFRPPISLRPPLTAMLAKLPPSPRSFSRGKKSS